MDGAHRAQSQSQSQEGKQMYTATGNTYKAKDDLKKIGFTWNKEEKRWEAETVDFEDWETKYLNPTWNGRKCARINAEANIEFVLIEE